MALVVLAAAMVAVGPSSAGEPLAPPAPAPDPRSRFEQVISDESASLADIWAARHDLLTAPASHGGSGLSAASAGSSCGAQPLTALAVRPVGADDLAPAPGDEVVTVAPHDADRHPAPACSIFSDHLRATLAGRSGSTGEPMWSAAVENLRFVTTADLTGDGFAEVITWEEAWAGYTNAEVTTRVAVRSGRTGESLWADVSRSQVLRHHPSASSALDLPIGVLVGDDSDGDGAADLVVVTATWQRADRSTRATIVADIVSGITGHRIGGTVAHGVVECLVLCSGGLPSIIPASDLTGDGRADLFVVEPSAAAAVVSASDHAGRRLWAHATATEVVDVTTGDVTADDRDDIVVAGADVVAIDGGDGSPLWRSDPLFWPTSSPTPPRRHLALRPDLDGDGVPEVSVVRWSSATTSDAVDVELRSGGDGHPIWARTVAWTLPTPHHAGDIRRDLACLGPSAPCPTVDWNDDGHPDLLLREIDWPSGWTEPVRSAYLLVDGASGEVARWEPTDPVVLGVLDRPGATSAAWLVATSPIEIAFSRPGDLEPNSRVAVEGTGHPRPLPVVTSGGTLAALTSVHRHGAWGTAVVAPVGVQWSVDP